tara:strand:- start:405 stop:617 length:213 start_codon:yes stop_codon:yes gene_type:complete
MHQRCVEVNTILLGIHLRTVLSTVSMAMALWVAYPLVPLFGLEFISNLRVVFQELRILYISHLVSNAHLL